MPAGNRKCLATIIVIATALLSLDRISSSHGASTVKRQKSFATSAVSKSCDKTILDRCSTVLMVFGRRDVYLPQNQPEMVPHCQEEFDAEDCIKDFARRCLPPFERQLAGMLMLGSGQVLRKRCASEGTKEYLTHYKCLKKTIPNLHDAMDQLVYSLMAISNQTDSSAKIPASCCSFARFQDYANRIVRVGCQDFDRTAEEYVGTKMIKGYVGDVLDLSCQGHVELASDKCARLELPNGGFEWRNRSLVRIPGIKLPAVKPNSVVPPFLDIFTNL